MKKSLHRSDNLLISLMEDEKTLEVEIRFSMSSARGRCDATCPRCGNPVAPTRWELEGPDGAGNTVWFECKRPLNGAEGCGGELSWTRRVEFADGWIEKDE